MQNEQYHWENLLWTMWCLAACRHILTCHAKYGMYRSVSIKFDFNIDDWKDTAINQQSGMITLEKKQAGWS